MIKRFLEDIGLSEKEAEVYTKLLTMESSSVIDLAKITKINRTTIYPVLETLMKKGLVDEITVDKKVKYQAEPPERLESYIQNEKTKLDEQSKLLSEVIPRLKNFALQEGERPIVKVYEGKEGILRSLKEYFQAEDKDDIAYLIYSRDLINQAFSKKDQEDARALRLSKKVKSRSIFVSSEGDLPSNDMAERYRIEDPTYGIKCDIGIYSDRIRIHTLSKNLSAIFIKSQDVADTFRTLFDLAIEGIKAKKENKD